MAEVETAARTGLPIVSVLLNNSTLAWIKHTAHARYPGEMVSQTFLDVNYAAAAQGLGAETARVDKPERFDQAFRAALADTSSRPWVIEAVSDAIETPVLPARLPSPTRGGY
jgi:acetolactate synthase-1/2/3 large subunit